MIFWRAIIFTTPLLLFLGILFPRGSPPPARFLETPFFAFPWSPLWSASCSACNLLFLSHTHPSRGGFALFKPFPPLCVCAAAVHASNIVNHDSKYFSGHPGFLLNYPAERSTYACLIPLFYLSISRMIWHGNVAFLGGFSG